MRNFSRHMRICAADVRDEDVISRRSSAEALAIKWGGCGDPLTVVSKVSEVAAALGGGIVCDSLGEEVQAEIQRKSPSYLYEERPMDVSVCAGMAVASIFSGENKSVSGKVKDWYAVALWSALGYQAALNDMRREELRSEVLEGARKWAIKSAEMARSRIDVPYPKDIKIEALEVDEEEEGGEEEGGISHNIVESFRATIDALTHNAELDREELDFLWWAQLGRSRLLGKTLAKIGEPTRIVAAGIEGARLLQRIPCDVHREIVLRTLDEDPELDLHDLITALDSDRAVLGDPFKTGPASKYPCVFPLLNALATGNTTSSGGEVKRRVSEWGSRALLEAGFVRHILTPRG